jgi:ParB/RepB/Spo0J family partition protein
MSAVTVQPFPTLPLAAIRASSFNPRKRFDPAKLKELTESVRQDGVLEPILVRPVPKAKDGTAYEIVAGERRFRAATEAQLDAIPVIVRDLSDAKALELAVIENLLRQDLNPIEEAEGFQRLLQEHGYSADDLAAKTGKSRAYVYTRLKLVHLPEIARKALWEDRINASVALLIARIPDAKLQVQATKDILSGEGTGEPMTLRLAVRYVQSRYMLSLGSAPFPTRDADLVPSAGACATCPKRTGNNPDLFGDVSRADVCTDPGCFSAKKDAEWQRVQLRAADAGQVVLTDQDSRRLFHGERVAYGSPYVDLAARCDDDAKGRNWQKLLGKHAPRHVLARDEAGRVHQLVRRAEAEGALRKAGHRFEVRSQAEQRRIDEQKKEETKRRRRIEVLRRGADTATAELVARVEAQEPSAAYWRILVDGMAGASWHEVIATACKRRGWSEKNVRPGEVIVRRAASMSAAQLRALVLELMVTRGAFTTWGTPGFGKTLTAACAAYRVDLKKIEEKTREEVAAKSKPRK